ncbi:MAG: FtsX-like permease family protein, partial [Terriglobales bacterium]
HDVASSLWLLLAAVGLLLLIACANVAGLVLAQTLGRREEIALRRALGAGGGRLWVQFLSEGLVLGVVGGAAGVGLAALALRTLAARLPWDIPLAAPLALDARVLAFAVALTLATSLTVALAGLWQGSGPRLAVTRFGKSGRARDLLMVAEVALSLLLLVGAGLLLKSLWRLQQQPLGFDPAGRVIFQTELPAAPATSAAAAGQFEQQLQARLQALPGVAQAASASLLPLEGQGNIPGEPLARPALGSAVEYRSVSADFFSAMGIPLLAGRNFLGSDDAAAAPVAVVGAKLARQWFATAGALGGAVRLGAIGSNVYDADLAAKPLRVVGIAGDTQIESLGEPARLTVYVPAAQAPGWASWWVVRGRGLNAATLRNAVAELNPNARVSNLGPYAEVVGQALARPRFEARLVALFALLALALAAIGLYGVLAFAVTARTRELGVRMALGARPSTLLRQVAGHGLALALAGAALGLAAAWPLAQLTASLLYNVHPHDPAVLAGATAAVLAAAAAASYLPARRATRVDPVRALRQE